jgi:dienelactone hydrolase
MTSPLHPRLPAIAALASLLLGLGAAADGLRIELADWPGAGPVHVALPPAAALPLVIILPDSMGRDRRGVAYAERLNAAGIATIEPDPSGGEDIAEEPARQLATVLATAVADPRFDSRRIGLLGFGRGGRVALAGAEGRPVAALYPGCRPLPSEVSAGPILLLEAGGLDEVEGDCDAFRRALGTQATHHLYPGATYAWDYADGAWLDSVQRLPSPDGASRLLSRSDPALAEDSVARVAGFMVPALQSPAGESGR